MVALDTNVLVRYLTRDDAEQYVQAKATIEGRCTPEMPGFISTVVLCEVVWVLKRAYGANRSEISEIVERLTLVDALALESAEAVRLALADYRASTADFADCLIGRLAEAHGYDTVLTFDRKAAKLDTFNQL
ncbi:MAG: type II toxin-antitoxin system VapC family toxin [Bacteroidota bacterium]